MLTKSEIFRTAWVEYRSMNASPAHETRGYDISFSGCLKWAWKLHKQAIANLAKEQEAARHKNAAAIRAVDSAISDLTFKPFGINAAAQERALRAKRAELVAA